MSKHLIAEAIEELGIALHEVIGTLKKEPRFAKEPDIGRAEARAKGVVNEIVPELKRV